MATKGLTMDSHLSVFMVCLYIETLETDNCMRRMGRGSTGVRYVDNVLMIVPKGTNIGNKLRILNNVNNDIQFTVEEEKGNRLTFPDAVIWRRVEVKFSSY